MRSRAWRAAVAGLALVAACGQDEPTRAVGDDPAPRSPVVEAMWAEDDGWVDDGPGALHLPGPDAPDDAVLTEIRLPDPALVAGVRPQDSAQTLYADPDAADPATGRALIVGRTDLNDWDGFLDLPDGDPVEVQGVEGEVVEVADLVVVRWPDEDAGLDCGCERDWFVGGRGVDRADVVAAAEVADPRAARPSLPPAATEGLAPLGTMRMTLHEPIGPPVGLRLEVTTEGMAVDVAVAGGDARQVAHVRFWAPDGATVTRHPHPTMATVLADGSVAIATGASRPPGEGEPLEPEHFAPVAEAVLASLVPATEADVAAAQQEIVAGIPLTPCAIGNGPQVDITGVTGDVRWTVGVAHHDGILETCDALATTAGEATGGGLGAGGHRELDLTGPVEVVGGSTASDGGRWYRVVIGHVLAPATGVEVTVPGAAPVEAVLADAGPTPDRVWFATAVAIPGPAPGVEVTAVPRFP